jgi:hypothetical protein
VTCFNCEEALFNGTHCTPHRMWDLLGHTDSNIALRAICHRHVWAIQPKAVHRQENLRKLVVVQFRVLLSLLVSNRLTITGVNSIQLGDQELATARNA